MTKLIHAELQLKRTTLGQEVAFKKGYAFKSEWYSDIGLPIVKVSDFTDSSIDSERLVCIPTDIPKDLSQYELRTGDVVIQTVGSWPSNPGSVVGKVIRVPSSVAGALLNQNAVKLSPLKVLDQRFLFYRLRCADFKDYIVGTAQGAANQASITLDSIKAFEFDLPDTTIQKRISSILSAYDDLIGNNAHRIKILERMAQMLYREWFVNLQFPGHEKIEMVNSEIGPIPRGWIPSSLGEMCEEVRRGVDPTEIAADTPYIGLEHMPRRSIALSRWGEAGQVQSTKLWFHRGEILFGKIRPYFHKVGVAPIDGVCSSDAIVIVPKALEYFSVVLMCVSSDDFIGQASQTSQGTKMPRANWAVLCRYPIARPDSPLLDRFNTLITPMLELINNLVFSNRCLSKTRDLLLPKLVSGEVSVERLESEAIAQNA
jgi:type I restriction enzyme, S subunit